MGVDLGELVDRKVITLESLSGKTIALDAFNVIYQFLSSIRQEDGTPLMDFKGRVTAHLSGLFYRNARLIENGIKPVYVFDGKPPDFKQKEKERREERKREAEEKWHKALEEERVADAKRFAQATSRLTSEMIAESKELLAAMGIPWLQAPSEGEAQTAVMAKNDEVYASSSQDYDSILFGSPRLIRNISITGKRKVPRQDRFIMVQPEEIILSDVLKKNGLTQEQLVWVGILVGTDYNEGIRGVGPKTALKIVKEYGSLRAIEEYVKKRYNQGFEADIYRIEEFFLHPPYEKPGKMEWGKMDENSLKRILVEEHDFSDERVGRMIELMLASYKEKGAQKKLEGWF